MNYRLAILTHGNMGPLFETMRSFREFVRPAPAETMVFYDGPLPFRGTVDDDDLMHLYQTMNRVTGVEIDAFSASGHDRGIGFCAATGQLWRNAMREDEVAIDYVFWLEHDFRFIRHVDLHDLAYVLAGENKIAQVALVRNACNPTEEAAGGLIESRPEAYERRELIIGVDGGENIVHPYLVHRAYFTTNPSLMRRRFMLHNPWPGHPRRCEGKFGIELEQRGWQFAHWGEGEVYVEHFGERNGHGY